MIKIKKATEVGFDFIKDIINIDCNSYSEKYRGTEESVRARFEANKESYLLCFENEILIGYICFFPITDSLSENIQKCDHVYDDDISPKDILTYEREKSYDIMLISVAILPQHRGKKIGSVLVRAMLDFLCAKQRENIEIKRIFSEVISDGGCALLSGNGFETLSHSKGAILMQYKSDDYSRCDAYIFVPVLCEDEKNVITPSRDLFIENLEQTAKEEFCGNLPQFLERTCVSSEKLVIVNDSDTKVTAVVPCVIYATRHKKYASIIIRISGLSVEPCNMLNQVTANNLYILSVDGNKILLSEFLKKYGYVQVDRGKTLLCLEKVPPKQKLMYMLASEAFVDSYFKTSINSSYIGSKAENNIAEYDYYDMFVSEKTVVFAQKSVSDSAETRLDGQRMIIFIVELIMLQICSVSSNYETILSCLGKEMHEQATTEYVNYEYSKAAQLWDVNNFKYLTSEHIATNISDEFGISRLKEEYRINLGTFEKMSSMSTQKRTEEYSRKTKKYFTVFSLLSGFSTLNAFIDLLFCIIYGEGVDVIRSITSLSLGLLSVSLFLFLVTMFPNRRKKIGRKNNDKTKKKLM